jgi:hypothetical protein|tara:strand:- start:5561 stop:5746 length:186 start_codon:yes stop_codon:yes gene_type:complete
MCSGLGAVMMAFTSSIEGVEHGTMQGYWDRHGLGFGARDIIDLRANFTIGRAEDGKKLFVG